MMVKHDNYYWTFKCLQTTYDKPRKFKLWNDKIPLLKKLIGNYWQPGRPTRRTAGERSNRTHIEATAG